MGATLDVPVLRIKRHPSHHVDRRREIASDIIRIVATPFENAVALRDAGVLTNIDQDLEGYNVHFPKWGKEL